MSNRKTFGLVAALAVMAIGANAVAAPFGSGNIVIVRVGNGTQTLTNTGNSVFLDEYTTNSIWAAAGGFSAPVPVQSIQMPTNWVGANGPLIMDGTTLGDGALSLSTDGRYLSFAGYGATFGQITNQSLLSTTTTGLVNQIPRVIGLVDGNGHIYTTTTLIDGNEDGNSVHCAVTLEGTNIWHVGEGNATGGKYTTRSSMTSTQVEELSRFNSRFFNIYNKTLYYSANHIVGAPTNTSGAVNPFSGSLPTSFVNSNFLFLSGVMGSSITSSPAIGSPFAFCLFSLNGGAAPDTLYVADNTTNAPGEPLGHSGGVVKYCYLPSSNAWVNFGYIYAQGATGVTGQKNGTNVTLYITEGGSATPGELNVLYPYYDTSGFAGSPQSNGDGGDANGNSEPLGPPGVNASLINTRGIAFAPQGGDAGTISAGAGVISVGPPVGAFFSGPQGGPFLPSNGVSYSVANLGGTTTNFTITLAGFPGGGNFVTASPSSGTLSPGATTIVTLSATNTTAIGLPGGFTTSGNVLFHKGGIGGAVAASVKATLTDLAFFILPSSDFTSLGEPGGPFTPLSTVYTLTNVTGSSLPWTASTSASWNSLSATSGTLAALSATNITVSITAAANSLPLGTYSDVLLFTNVTAGAALPSRNITLQVGFGFFDDFSTYSNGFIVGQNNWYNPTGGLDDNGYQIVNGVLVTPGGNDACITSSDQEPAKNIAAAPVTNSTAFAYLGMSMTVTSAPSQPNTWDFTLLPTVPGGNVTINEARTSVSDAGGGKYKWWTHVNGYDALIPSTITRSYFTNYIVIIVGDIVNSNCWVFVNPPNATTNSLFAMTPDTYDGPTVPGWSGPGSVGVGSMDMDNYCGNGQPGFLISKMALSTNYSTVYNFLTATNSSPPADPFTTWQSNYFTMAELGTPSFSGPNADPYGKGMSNTNQFMAGFNPTNAAAYLHITAISKTNSGTDVRVDFLGASGDSTYSGGPASRTNVLEFTAGTSGSYNSNSFASTGVTNILSGGTGLGTLANMVDPGGATNKPSRYYRVRVLVP